MLRGDAGRPSVNHAKFNSFTLAIMMGVLFVRGRGCLPILIRQERGHSRREGCGNLRAWLPRFHPSRFAPECKSFGIFCAEDRRTGSRICIRRRQSFLRARPSEASGERRPQCGECGSSWTLIRRRAPSWILSKYRLQAMQRLLLTPTDFIPVRKAKTGAASIATRSLGAQRKFSSAMLAEC